MTTRIECWMGRSNGGSWLCKGNPNPDFSYSISYPFDANYITTDRFLFCRTKAELMEHISAWRGELRKYAKKNPHRVSHSLMRQLSCRPEKMVISWKPYPHQ